MKKALVVVVLLAAASPAFAQEPGVAALDSARAALARLAAAAASPTPNTAPLGPALQALAKPGAPAAPEQRGQTIDSAAQPFLADVEPRLVELRDRILDRRYRFLTGTDRPKEGGPEQASAVIDIRSLLGSAADEDSSPKASPASITTPPLAARPVHFEGDLVRDLVAAEIGEGSCSYDAGALFVRAAPADLARARAVVQLLREAAGQRLALEVSAFRLTREAWTELAAQGSEADFERVLERALVAKSAATLEDRSFVVEDGALTRVVSGARRATVTGTSTDQTGVVPVLNPELGKIELGLQGDVRATIAPGGSLAIVDVDLALRRGSLGAHATFAGQDVQLPETSVTRLATTLTVPLGRTVFLGGTFGETASVASACVFSVRVQRFGERAVAPLAAPAPPRGPAPVPSARKEVVELDGLLVLVEDALAKVRASRRLEWRTFDVRDLLEGTHARSVPRLGVLALPPRGKAGGGNFTFDDDTEEAPVGLEPEKLEALLKNATGAEAAWPERALFQTRGGQLLIRQTPGTLARIAQLLAEYRKGRAGDVQVLVELCRVDDALLAELTKGGAGLGPEILKRVEDALAAGTSAVRVASGFVRAQRGDPGVLHAGVETAYVAGFERSSGGTGEVVQTVTSPLVRVARQGFSMAAFGHGDLEAGEAALTVGARFGLAHSTELATARTPAGDVSLPALDHASGWFDGPSPSGAVALIVDRRVGEPRPTLVAIVRSRLVR